MKNLLKKFALIITAISVIFVSACKNEPDPVVPTKVYTVTFNKNTTDPASLDADPKTKTVTPPVQTIGNLPAEPIWPGYLFTEWNTKSDGSGDTFNSSTLVAANITVFAQWFKLPAVYYTVTFDKNDIGATNPYPGTKVVIPPATTIDNLPSEPTRSGKEFAGWFTVPEATGGTRFTATSPVTGDITVYARWSSGGLAECDGNCGCYGLYDCGMTNCTCNMSSFNLLAHEDFSTYDLGEVTVQTYYYTSAGISYFSIWPRSDAGASSPAHTYIVEDPEYGNVVKLTGGGTTASGHRAQLIYNSSGSDRDKVEAITKDKKVYISFKAKLASGNTSNAFGVPTATYRYQTGSNNGSVIRQEWNSITGAIRYTPGGGSWYTGDVCSVNEWHEFGILADFETKIYTMIIDGGKVFDSSFETTEDSGLGQIQLWTHSSEIAYISEITVMTDGELTDVLTSKTITFDKNAIDAVYTGPATKTLNYPANLIDVMPVEPTRAGYEFGGWYDTTSSIGGNKFTEATPVINGTMTVYARWIAPSCEGNCGCYGLFDCGMADCTCDLSSFNILAQENFASFALGNVASQTNYYTSKGISYFQIWPRGAATGAVTEIVEVQDYGKVVKLTGGSGTAPADTARLEYNSVNGNDKDTIGQITENKKVYIALKAKLDSSTGSSAIFGVPTVTYSNTSAALRHQYYANGSNFQYNNGSWQNVATADRPATGEWHNYEILADFAAASKGYTLVVDGQKLFDSKFENDVPFGLGSISLFSQGAGVAYISEITVMTNGELPGTVTAAKTVTFDMNAVDAVYTGPAVKTLNYPDNLIDELPVEPTRSGYGFGGWFTTDALTGGTEFTVNTRVMNNMTVYARWLAPECEGNCGCYGLFDCGMAKCTCDLSSFNLLAHEDFESFTLGNVAAQTNYYASKGISYFQIWPRGSASGATTDIVADPAYGKVIRLVGGTGTAGGDRASISYNAVTGTDRTTVETITKGKKVYFSFKAKLIGSTAGTPANAFGIPSAEYSSGSSIRNDWSANNGNIRYNKGGTWTTINSACTTDAWHDFGIMADHATKQYTMYIDRVKAFDSAFETSADLGMGQIIWWITGTQTAYIAEIKVMTDGALTGVPTTKTVTFDKNAEDAVYTGPATKILNYPANLIDALPVEPTRPGYDFGGWYTTSTGGTEFTTTTRVINETMTVYAKWNAPTCNGNCGCFGLYDCEINGCTCSVNSGTLIANINFEDRTLGAVANGLVNVPAGGIGVYNMNVRSLASGVEIIQDAELGSKVLKLTGASGTANADRAQLEYNGSGDRAKIEKATRGKKVYVTFKAKLENYGSENANARFDTAIGQQNEGLGSNAAASSTQYYAGSSTYSYRYQSGTTWTNNSLGLLDQWNDFSVIIDYNARTYVLYVNGNKIGGTNNFANTVAGDVGMGSVSLYTIGSATVYLDNIIVRTNGILE